jgi:ferredoxin-NADP reductase
LTAPQLLAYIVAALLIQLAAGVGVVVWRRRGVEAQAPAVRLDEASERSTGAWPGWREFRVVRRVFEDRAQTQCSFYLEPVDGVSLPPFLPGQFLTFSLQVADGAAPPARAQRAIVRCYSLSDRPDPRHYRVTIKRLPPPAGRADLAAGVSSNHFHDRVHEGDVLMVKAPAGHFVIDPDPNVPTVLIAGGIGITPMMSMLRWSLAEQPGRTVHLYYGLRNGDEHAFKPVLEQLAASHPNFHLNAVYSRADPNDVQGRDYQHAGHVDADLLRRTLPHGRHQFYVCGPAAMMQSLVPALAHWGVPRQDIHFEAFGPASVRFEDAESNEPVARLAAAVEVRFHRSGRTLAWDGQDANLLEFAERHGVAVDSGCRSGSCGTCETRLVSGTVAYAHPPDHDVAPGHCLLCVGTPASALVLEA